MAANGSSNGHGQNIPLIINGESIQTSTTFEVHNPSNSEHVFTSSSAGVKEAISAVESAQAAFPAWSRTRPSHRRDILLKTADIFESRIEEMSVYVRDETGAPDMWGGFNAKNAIEMLRDCAGRISTICGSVPECADEGTSAIVYKEPYGVVLGIAPWYVTCHCCFRLGAVIGLGGW